jgi:hypothetical protein
MRWEIVSSAGCQTKLEREREVYNVRVPDSSMMTPRYTVANCFGKDKNAAKANVNTFMPHVAKTAVVTL